MVRRFGRLVAVAAIVVVIGVLSAVAATWWEHHASLTLPLLPGPYAVGRASFDWRDDSRVDALAPSTGVERELTVWMWYPARSGGASHPSDYLPPPLRAALARYQSPVLSLLLLHDPSTVRTRSVDGALPAASQRPFPIVLVKPGIGAMALDYTTLAEDLASSGYVVVASDSPYSTVVVVYADGRLAVRRRAANAGESAPIAEQARVARTILPTWVGDDRFVLDRLAALDASGPFRGRLALDQVGAMGHSFGGATSAEFCRVDARCKAAIDIDGIPFGGVVREPVRRPLMFFLSDHSRERGDAETATIMSEFRDIYRRSPPGRAMVALRGSSHFSFSDKPLLFNREIARISGIVGSIDPVRALDASDDVVRTFFDVHLKGAPASRFQDVRARYPELVFSDSGVPYLGR